MCLNGKLLLVTYPDQKQLLKLRAKCRHENKFLLINYKSKRLICRFFLKKGILYKEYFEEKIIFT